LVRLGALVRALRGAGAVNAKHEARSFGVAQDTNPKWFDKLRTSWRGFSTVPLFHSL